MGKSLPNLVASSWYLDNQERSRMKSASNLSPKSILVKEGILSKTKCFSQYIGMNINSKRIKESINPFSLDQVKNHKQNNSSKKSIIVQQSWLRLTKTRDFNTSNISKKDQSSTHSFWNKQNMTILKDLNSKQWVRTTNTSCFSTTSSENFLFGNWRTQALRQLRQPFPQKLDHSL